MQKKKNTHQETKLYPYRAVVDLLTEAEANHLDSKNHKIWDNFWKIPREKRQSLDWKELQKIRFLIQEN